MIVIILPININLIFDIALKINTPTNENNNQTRVCKSNQNR